MRDLLARIAGWARRARRLPVRSAATGAGRADRARSRRLRLEADAGTDQLVDRDSEPSSAPRTSSDEFGDDAVVVLVQGDLEQLVLTEDLGTLLALEGCLSGNAPGGAGVRRRAGAGAVRRARRAASRRGSSTGPRPSSTSPRSRPEQLLGEQSAGGAARRRRRRGAQAALEARRAGLSRGRAGRPRRRPPAQEVLTRVPAAAARARDPLRADRHPAARRPAVRQPGRLRHAHARASRRRGSRTSSRAPTRR